MMFGAGIIDVDWDAPNGGNVRISLVKAERTPKQGFHNDAVRTLALRLCRMCVAKLCFEIFVGFSQGSVLSSVTLQLEDLKGDGW